MVLREIVGLRHIRDCVVRDGWNDGFEVTGLR